MNAPLALIGTGGYISKLTGGRKLVAAAGTAERIVSVETPCQAVMIQVLKTNTGNIMLGGSDVDITAGSENGIELEPAQIATINVNDARRLFIDSLYNDDGVAFLILG